MDETLKIIITAIIAPIITYGGKKLVDSIYSKRNKCVNTIPSLTKHPFFERMKCLRHSIMYSFRLENRGKEVIFRDILLNMFNIFIKRMWKLCIRLDAENVDSATFYTLVMSEFRESIKEYSSYYKTMDYNDEERACIEIVMNKFNKWNYPRMDNSYKSIEMIANSKFYADTITRMASVLDMLLGQFVDTLNDAENTLNELNGDLKGLKFRGIEL